VMHEIARPVLPHEQDLDYVTTQVIAEYVVHFRGLDGIAYRSAQAESASQWSGIVDPRVEADARNVALFGAAARVTAEGTAAPGAGLRFQAGSQRMLIVTKISTTTEDDTSVHYPSVNTDEPE
jgi:hypothetical protein